MKFLLLKKNSRGFTLIEMLTVLALFSSMTTLALGSLFNVRSINNSLQEKETVLDNLNFSIQVATRDMRFGSDFYCAGTLPTTTPLLRKNCPSTGAGGSVIIFKPSETSSSTDRVAYYVKNGTFYKDEYLGGSTTTLQITSDEVTIRSVTFFVQGALSSDPADGLNEGGGFDYQQPLITMIISGIIKKSASIQKLAEFNIQTSVSSRILDNK